MCECTDTAAGSLMDEEWCAGAGDVHIPASEWLWLLYQPTVTIDVVKKQGLFFESGTKAFYQKNLHYKL